MEPNQPAALPPDHRRSVIASIATILLALLIAGAVWWNTKHNAQQTPVDESEYAFLLPMLSQESVANIPAGFPPQYILGVNTEVVSGDLTDRPDAGVVVREVKIIAENFPVDLIARYKDHLTRLNWEITSFNSSEAGGSIMAKRKYEDMVIIFLSEGRLTVANIKYSKVR